MYYSKLCSAVCEGVLTHPVTGEKYGGTDFANEGKLAELQAVPLSESDGDVPENPVQTGTTIIVAGDGLSATRVKTWRSKTEQELDDELDAAYLSLYESVNTIRAELLESLQVSVDLGTDEVLFDCNDLGRSNLNGVLTGVTNGLLPSDVVVPWRDSNNVMRNLDLDGLKLLGGAMIQGTYAVMTASWYIKDTLLPGLLASTSPIDSVRGFDVRAVYNSILNG